MIGSTGTGSSVVLLSDAGVQSLALDSNNVYWTGYASDGGVVMMVPKAGGPPVVLASGQQLPGPIAVDDTGVYWLNLNDDVHGGAVMKVSLDGGAPATLLTYKGFNPHVLAVQDGTVYVGDVYLAILPPDGGSPTYNSWGQVAFAAGLARDGTNLYFAVYDPGSPPTVDAIPIAMAGSTPPTALASLSGNDVLTGGIAVDGTSVYVTDNVFSDVTHQTLATAAILKTALNGDGGAPSTVVSIPDDAGLLPPIRVLDTDGTNVYFPLSANIIRVPVGGGTPVALITFSSPDSVTDVKVDTTSVYVGFGAGLVKIAK
jgi:hypothetical protein